MTAPNNPPPSLRITANKANEALWQAAEFQIATKPQGKDPRTEKRGGFTHKGLGIFKLKGEEVWSVTNLASGHALFLVRGTFGIAVEIATMLASLGDWEFGGLRGFENMSHDLFLKVKMLYQMFGGYCFQPEDMPTRNEALADEIAKAQVN